MITLPPFKAFLASNIPSVYDNTLTYYEELVKLIAYLENEVVPAVNKTAAEVDGVLEAFKQLKDYVDHYFENLDVQEEINNKLDAMAEGGELAGIIAQFLELAPVFAYDTIATMAAADNLSNGCIARVLGNTAAADGDGAYYTIRTRIESDNPDGVNLVAIGDTLVGTRVSDKTENDLEEYIDDNYINVKFEGAAGDGTTDDTTVLQGLIDNNPHKTLYFPAGTYLISSSLNIPTGNAYQVNLKLDKNAVITTNENISFLLVVGAEEATGTHTYNRYAEGSIVSIDGGIFKCGSADGAIKLTANQKQTKVTNTIIYDVEDYGIYIDRGINTSNSSDADINNVSINGKGSDIGGTGIYAYGLDNKISHVRVNKCQIGINDVGGSYYFDVHALGAYSTDSPTTASLNATKGFVFAGGGGPNLVQCYADTFATAFEISGAGTATVQMTNCLATWWYSTAEEDIKVFNINTSGTVYHLIVDNLSVALPNAGNVTGMDISGSGLYLGVYEFIKFSNIQITNVAKLSNNDWITCRAFYEKNAVQIHDPWTLTMTQNQWYPVAYLRTGMNSFRLRMANDQGIEVNAYVGATCQISVKNVFSYAHANEYEVALCNAAQESDRGNVWGAILCVRSTSANCGYNPCISGGVDEWGTQIFTRRNFMGSTPLVNPDVNASESFNPV